MGSIPIGLKTSEDILEGIFLIVSLRHEFDYPLNEHSNEALIYCWGIAGVWRHVQVQIELYFEELSLKNYSNQMKL